MDSLFDMEEHLEKVRRDKKEYNRKWYVQNREHQIEASRKWYEENQEYCRERRRKYREKNRDRILKYNNEWLKTEKGRACMQRVNTTRRARVNGVISTLTAEEWKDILRQYNYKCAYCGRSILDLPDGLVRDHVIPICRGGDNTKENIVPACSGCNSSKGVRLVDEILVR